MPTISLPLLKRNVRFFDALTKSGDNFSVEVETHYTGNCNPLSTFHASITSAKTIADVSSYFLKLSAPLAGKCFNKINQEPQLLYSHSSAVKVAARLAKNEGSSIKFFAEEAFQNQDHIEAYHIAQAPIERQHGGHTYRIVTEGQDRDYAQIVACVPETHALYDYLDRGHIVVFSQSTHVEEGSMLIADQLTLDVNFIIAAFSVFPAAVTPVLTRGVFLPYRDARALLVRVERAMPPRHRDEYFALKTAVTADFEKNSQNVTINRLCRKEVDEVVVNRIKISKTKATYENISIEADDLAEVILRRLNVMEEWDIFTLVNIYAEHVESLFTTLKLNESHTGFENVFSVRFKINDVDINVAVSKTSTRRSINGCLIRQDELAQLIGRASCFLDPNRVENNKSFNHLTREVARMSLHITDVWNNGLPVKSFYFEGDINSNNATARHPKLKFRHKDGAFFLMISPEVERKMCRFVEFVYKMEANNRKHRRPYYQDEGMAATNALNSCATGMLPIFQEYVEDITAEEVRGIIAWINKDRLIAEAKSEAFLADAIEANGAVRMQSNGRWGYRVDGILRSYFVHEDTAKVYGFDTKKEEVTSDYFCIVNGHGFQGVGRDALVMRLYILKNDAMVTSQVHTLAQKNYEMPVAA